MDKNPHHSLLVSENKANLCQWGMKKNPLMSENNAPHPLGQKEINSSSQFILTLAPATSIKCLKQNVSPPLTMHM